MYVQASFLYIYQYKWNIFYFMCFSSHRRKKDEGTEDDLHFISVAPITQVTRV